MDVDVVVDVDFGGRGSWKGSGRWTRGGTVKGMKGCWSRCE